MKINTTKRIASINFHGSNFAEPEWIWSKSHGSDLDLYSGAAVFLGDKGDKSSYEWCIVAGDKLINVGSKDELCAVFHCAAQYRCDANRMVSDPLGKDAEKVDAEVAQAINDELLIQA